MHHAHPKKWLLLIYLTLQSHTYTLVSHNAASIQVNPLEYRSVFREIANDKKHSAEVKSAAKKLLFADENWDFSGKVSDFLTEKIILQLLQAIPPELMQRITTQKVAHQARLFAVQYQHQSLYEAFTQKKISGLNKIMRELGPARFEFTAYNSPVAQYYYYDYKNRWGALPFTRKIKSFDLDEFVTKWCESVRPSFPILIEKMIKKGRKNNFLQEYLLTFLFDCQLAKNLLQDESLFFAWLTFVKTLEDSPLGKDEMKNYTLFSLYNGDEPDIVFLQEATAGLGKLFKEDERYFVCQHPSSQGDAGDIGSILCFSRKYFDAKRTTYLQLHPSDLVGLPSEGILEKDQKKLLTKEFALAIAYPTGEAAPLLIGSFHADSKGRNTPLCIRLAIKKWRKLLHTHQGASLILAMDSNTTHNPIENKDKRDIQDLVELLPNVGGDCYMLRLSGYADTVNKQRSNFQLQFSKSGKRYQGESDVFILSKDLRVKHRATSESGPTLHQPSDHRKLLVKVRR